jgi:hypothetical protein
MPWEIKEGTSQCSGYGVFKEGTSELAGCHSTRAAAQRQVAALYASESKTIKMMEPGTFEEGDFAMAMVDEELHAGQIIHIMRDGMLGVEGSEMNVMATLDNPAVLVRIFEQDENGYWEETPYFVGFSAMSGIKIDKLPKESENIMENNMSKSVRVGAMVSWNSSGGRAKGKVKRIIRNGSYNVPDSDFTITGTPDNPAVVIELYRDGKPTGRMVGHRMSTLRVAKSVWSSFNPRSVARKSNEVIFSKKDYSTSARRRMAASGQALPDGSFPIANRADLMNAIRSVGRASNYEQAKKHIMRRARALGATDMLPKDWK